MVHFIQVRKAYSGASWYCHWLPHRDAHVYVIEDESFRHSLIQSFRARNNPNKSSMFAQNAERAAKTEALLIEQLQRPNHVLKWKESKPVDALIEKLEDLSNCNVFLNQSNLNDLLLKFFQKQNYVHCMLIVSSALIYAICQLCYQR